MTRSYDLAHVIGKLTERMAVDGPTKVAADMGVSKGFLIDIRKGARKPSAKVLAALGFAPNPASFAPLPSHSEN